MNDYNEMSEKWAPGQEGEHSYLPLQKQNKTNLYMQPQPQRHPSPPCR